MLRWYFYGDMKTLAASDDVQSIRLRLEKLSPNDTARWGRMNVHQMVCHLCDSMRVPLGEKVVSDAEMRRLQRTIMKWAALYLPLKWPRDVPTRPEIDQCRLNGALNDFESDRQSAISLVPRLRDADLEGKRHPIFGLLTRAQWLRWGWLHADHHLRQFGRRWTSGLSRRSHEHFAYKGLRGLRDQHRDDICHVFGLNFPVRIGRFAAAAESRID